MMSRTMKRGGALLLAAAMLGLAACSGGGGTADSSNILKRGTASEPPSLDPHIAQGNTSSALIDDLFTGLTTTDANGQMTGGLAERWEVSDDGLVWTFHLRPDLKWSDGTPLAAEDVVWSFRRLMDQQTGARYAANLYAIKGARAVNQGAPVEQLGVSAPDAQTVRFELEQPTPYFPRILTSNATVPVPRHAIEANGRNWTKPGAMVSNGAFTLTEWVPNTRIEVRKNPTFFDAAHVSLDGVTYFPTDNTGTLVNRFRAGEVDVILNFPPDQTDFLRRNFGDEVQVRPNKGLYYFLFNTKKPPFDNVKVRKALSIAIDKDAIVQQVLKGEGVPAWSLVPDDISDYKGLASPDAATPYAERVKEAQALLAAAGYGEGKPLTLELRYDSKEDSRQIAVAMSEMWKAIGVTTSLKASDFRGIVSDTRSGKFDVIRYQWFAPYDDPSTFLALIRGRSATNLTGYANPRYDAALSAADARQDMAVRMQALAQAEADAMQDYPVLPIHFTMARRIVSSRVKGWHASAEGSNLRSRWLSLDSAAKSGK